MERTCLVAGLAAPLLAELAEELAASGARALVSSETGKPPAVDQEIEKKIAAADWTPRSPLSARNLILSALNRFDRIDQLVYVCPACPERRPLHELSSDLIEETVDGALKGCLFLLKEAARQFQKQGGGLFAVVLHERPTEEPAPLDGLCAGAIKGLVSRLFLQYDRGPIAVQAFQSAVEPTREYAAFVAAGLGDPAEKNRGRWIKYVSKGGFFSFGRR
jgi:NAD(P)-dependent dehydrogenase (short-subunit alcohol dehydrogenase family)